MPEDLEGEHPHRGSDGPLHLLIDSTGIKVDGEGEWYARKHGGSQQRVWRNIHIGIDEKSLEIRAAEFTLSDVGRCAMMPELLDQIQPGREIAIQIEFPMAIPIVRPQLSNNIWSASVTSVA